MKKSNVVAMAGTPEVSRTGGIRHKRGNNNKEPAGKLVAVKENSFKRQMLVGFAAAKNMALGLGIYAVWDDLVYFDPMQHYVVCIFAAALAVEAVMFKLSKIQ